MGGRKSGSASVAGGGGGGLRSGHNWLGRLGGLDGLRKGMMKTKLWFLTQGVVDGYDTYDSCVVAAETEDEAKTFHPRGNGEDGKPQLVGKAAWNSGSWPEDVKDVTAELLGEAVEGTRVGVICSSFNAG